MKSRSAAVALAGLAAFISKGCGPTPAPESGTDAAIKIATNEYWQAVMQPEWNGDLSVQPDWQKAYALLHPDAKSSLSFQEFSVREWHRVRSRGGCLWEVRIEQVQIHGSHASVMLGLRFGQPDSFGFRSRVTTELVRHGAQWSVVGVTET
jgi:hypothetical protein